MNTAQLIAYLKNALAESTSYPSYDFDRQPQPMPVYDGYLLAGQIRSLLVVLAEKE